MECLLFTLRCTTCSQPKKREESATQMMTAILVLTDKSKFIPPKDDKDDSRWFRNNPLTQPPCLALSFEESKNITDTNRTTDIADDGTRRIIQEFDANLSHISTRPGPAHNLHNTSVLWLLFHFPLRRQINPMNKIQEQKN
eukprot:TRINITY_DN709_c0_g1_i2.p1 TRINITY_DN709_c0_g1~~TRINITY_DN709_c0_g1_i2.p1  ORF type:complete len:141 (-),score=0.72 TRINITY_DN709_c0_g1_i2:65-487(-)